MQMVLLMFITILAVLTSIVVLFSIFGRQVEEEVPTIVPILGALSIILWFIAAAGVVVIDEPYSIVYENVENAGQMIVEHGTRQVTSNWPLSYLFFGFALLMLALLFIAYIEKIKGWLFQPRRRRGGF